MTTYTVALEDATVGTINASTPIGEGMEVTVALTDENGNKITRTGIVAEVLESSEPWEL